jgi:hypothetical protein
MTTRRFRALLLTASLLTVAACSDTSSRAVGGDATSTTSSPDATSATVAGVTTTLSAVTLPPATPAPTAPATNPPATNPPATSPPATAAPSNGPKVVSATFSGPAACASPDVSIDLPPPSVSISWSATNADSVYIAIDNPNGAFQQNLPLTGSISDLPFGCPGTHTYYVVAVRGAQTDIKSKTFTAN